MKRILASLLIALGLPAIAQSTIQPLSIPVLRAFDQNGKPLTVGKLWTYAAGTSTPLATYTDASGATPNTDSVILDFTGSAPVFLGTSAYKLRLENQFGLQQWSADDITGPFGIGCGAGNCIVGNPAAAQTINGKLKFRGATAPRTFLNPEFYSLITDTSPSTTNPLAQADRRLTPVLHIETNDTAPNNAAPIYAAHNCNYTTGPFGANGACVGMVPIVTSTAADEHYGLEAINAIVQIGNTDANVQAQGIELNQFNNSGGDSNILPTGLFNRGPYFGFSATAGGNNPMIAAYNVQDQRAIGVTGSGWHHGLWVGAALDDAILVGTPQGGPPIGLHQQQQGIATSTTNYSSTPIELDSNYWNGTGPIHTATYIGAYQPPGSTIPCFSVSYTTGSNVFTTCADGSTSQGVTVVKGGITILDNTLNITGASAGMAIGDMATTAPFIDAHSSGHAVGYDARIQFSGGTSTLGQGTINLMSGHVQTNGATGLTHTVTVPCGTMIFTNGLLTGVTGSC